jgi:glycosyltransferase involved in cell wall biosynthesis
MIARRSYPRILFVDHTGTVGGAELVLLDIAGYYRESCAVVLLQEGPFRQRLEAAGVTVQVVSVAPALHRIRRETRLPAMSAMAGVIGAARAVARLARKYDLLYANSQKALVVAAVAKLLSRRPLLWHLHDLLDAEHFSSLNIRVDVLLGNWIADRVVAVSQAVTDTFVSQGGRASQIRTVYNGIDPTAFTLPDSVVAAARTELGVAGPLIGSFSRLCSWKGQHLLIEALPQLAGAHALLVGDVLFGETEYAHRLHATAERLGVSDRVHFLGPRDDVARLMQAVDVIVHSPTAREPCGRVIIEAMLSSRPLIAAADGGTVELVQNGQTGLLFTPGSVPALVQAILRLLRNLDERQRLGDAARKYAVEHLSLESMVAGVVAQVDEVVSRFYAR